MKKHKSSLKAIGIFMAIILAVSAIYFPAMKTSAEITAVKCDINGDGIVSAKDIIRINKYLKKPALYEYSENADVNGDGTISEADLNAIFSFLGEKNLSLPINMTLHKSVIDGNKYSLYLSFKDNFNGNLSLNFKYGNTTKNISRHIYAKADEECAVSYSGIPFLSNSYTLEVTASNPDYSDNVSVSYVNGAPQLSKETVKMVVSAMTTHEKASLIVLLSASNAVAGQTYSLSRYGIPSAQFADGPAGLRLGNSTISYPSGTTLASTWNSETVRKVTAYIGDDCRNYGIDTLLAPGMNIQKNVLNGRNFEYFSEDPLLTGIMAANYTLGVQSTNVGVALKHYAANNQETERMWASSELTERALREIYLRGFGYAVRLADPYSVMTSYNKIQDTFSAENKGIIDVLRGEFGFNGMVMTDWGTIIDRVKMLNAGNDLYCGGYHIANDIIQALLNGLNDGTLELSQLELCCENILNYVAKSNAMSNASSPNSIQNKSAKLQAARQAAAEGTVLLKNDGNTLPLSKSKVALFGNASYITEYSGYGSGRAVASDVVNINEGLTNAGYTLYSTVSSMYKSCSQHSIDSADTANPQNDTYEISISSSTAKSAAKSADCAIFTVSRLSVEGLDHVNRAGDFCLNSRELQAIENISSAFHARNKKFIVIINTGNPIEVASWAHLADAIIYVGLAGEQIGNAVADVISGAITPSGKLTATWPIKFSDTPYAEYFPGDYTSVVYNDDIYVGYRYYSTFDVDVMYEFGYGLSYTTFEYSDFKIEKSDDNYILSVDIKNIGSVAGSEVVQFYVTKPDSKNEHPAMQLVGFGKTASLAPNQTQTITATVTAEELKTYSTDDSLWFIEKGEYKFHVGASVEKINFSGTVTIENETTVFDTENILKDTSAIAIITKDRPSFEFNSSKNIALNKSAAVSFAESGYPASHLTDGNLSTRWSAVGSTTDTFWVTVDLGSVQHIKETIILWQANTFGEFSVLVSTDNKNWEKIGSFNHAQANLITIDKDVRYVNVQGENDGYFSIYEIGIYK